MSNDPNDLSSSSSDDSSSDDSSSDDLSSSDDCSSDESSSDDSSSDDSDSSDESSSDDSSSSDDDSSSDDSSSDDSATDDSSSDDSSDDDSSSDDSSSDDSSSDDSSSSDDASSSSDGSGLDTPLDAGAVAMARTNADLDHANTLALSMIRIRLFDPDSNPMPSAAYRVTAGSKKWEDTATGDGWIEQTVGQGPASCLVEWGAGGDAGTYLYSATITLDFDQDPATSLAQRLQNLGYTDSDPLANADAFRQDYGYQDSDDIASILQGWHGDPTTIKPRQQTGPAASGDAPGTEDEDYG